LENVMSIGAGTDADVEQLYPRLAPQLRRILRANLQVPEWVLEDACQMAWTALLSSPAPVDGPRVLSWLATTARREVLSMLRRSEAELLLIDPEHVTAELDASDPQQAVEFWERLGQVRRLSRRQQRIVWMQGLGFRYEEIAAETGETVRSVERQLAAARRHLGSAA
jgi:RNA polymerase sigma factor (sigma-70 family)